MALWSPLQNMALWSPLRIRGMAAGLDMPTATVASLGYSCSIPPQQLCRWADETD